MLLSVFVRVNAGGGYFTSTPLFHHVTVVKSDTRHQPGFEPGLPAFRASVLTTTLPVIAQRPDSDLCAGSLCWKNGLKLGL